MYGEVERIGKEQVEAYFKILSWHSPGGTNVNYEYLQ
jgi:hypothetical protein